MHLIQMCCLRNREKNKHIIISIEFTLTEKKKKTIAFLSIWKYDKP